MGTGTSIAWHMEERRKRIKLYLTYGKGRNQRKREREEGQRQMGHTVIITVYHTAASETVHAYLY